MNVAENVHHQLRELAIDHATRHCKMTRNQSITPSIPAIVSRAFPSSRLFT